LRGARTYWRNGPIRRRLLATLCKRTGPFGGSHVEDVLDEIRIHREASSSLESYRCPFAARGHVARPSREQSLANACRRWRARRRHRGKAHRGPRWRGSGTGRPRKGNRLLSEPWALDVSPRSETPPELPPAAPCLKSPLARSRHPRFLGVRRTASGTLFFRFSILLTNGSSSGAGAEEETEHA